MWDQGRAGSHLPGLGGIGRARAAGAAAGGSATAKPRATYPRVTETLPPCFQVPVARRLPSTPNHMAQNRKF